MGNGRSWASGKHSRGICDRCGMEFAYRDLIRESGTGLLVDRECYDGAYDRVNHPLNRAPRDLSDGIALKEARPDSAEGAQGIFLFGQTSTFSFAGEESILVVEDGASVSGGNVYAYNDSGDFLRIADAAGSVSGTFATEYSSKLVLSPAGGTSYPLLLSVPTSANLLGINASCVSGDAAISIVVANTTVESSVAVNTSSGNTTISATIDSGESVDFTVTTQNACKSMRVDLAYIRKV